MTPVALAMIGTEMAIDEEVSGKKASLKSADIMSEAKDLAKMRAKEKELEAVALLLKDKAARAGIPRLHGRALRERPRPKSPRKSRVASAACQIPRPVRCQHDTPSLVGSRQRRARRLDRAVQ